MSYLRADDLIKEEERIFRDHNETVDKFCDMLFGTTNLIKEFRRFVVLYNNCLKQKQRQFDSEEMKCLGIIINIGHLLQKNKDHIAFRFSLMYTMEEMLNSLSILIDDYPSRSKPL